MPKFCNSPDDITIGADPEFFLFRDGEPVSAHDIVPGTKKHPQPLKDGVAVQADGTAVEFNIPICKTTDEFVSSLHSALRQIRKIIPKKYEFKFTPTVEYNKEYFQKLPRIATEIGCSMDYQAYHRGRRRSPPAYIGSLCAGGGHLHIGWGEDLNTESPGHLFDCCELIKSVDTYFKSYEKFWDKDVRRKGLYGTLGAFRPKTYGVEYRGLSNAWLGYPELWPWIFNATKKIFKRLTEVNDATYPQEFSYYLSIEKTNELFAKVTLPPMPKIKV